MTDEKQENEILDTAVAEGGAYDILRRRLLEMGQSLRETAQDLNGRRLEEFGKSTMDVIGRFRIRMENNGVARDIVRVGDVLLFGCNVFIGLKKETRIEDVFSLYRLEEHEDGYDVTHVPVAGSFLDIPSFVQDFTELHTYYRNARLQQLSEKNGTLLASFQIGDKVSDVRVFRWSISPDGKDVRYIDNRGERDISLPPAHDFEWSRTGRENVVNGRYPHVNILDTVFVETVGGDLTIKRENNTEDGLGIYREDVLDANQSINDANIEYAQLGSLILLKILPYRESDWRYLVYNTLTHDVKRIDAIGQACVQLPEDHGIIFPGGYYLQNGESKTFDQPMEGMHFRRTRKSPNGEDVLYVFYEPVDGRLALFNYNMIDRQVQNPLLGNGYTLLEDGRMVIFEDQGGEATRVHPMQIWQTPYYTDEYAARTKSRNTILGRIGNAELVRGISDLYHVVRQIETQSVSAALYEKLCQDTHRLFDTYFWLKDEANFAFAPLLRDIVKTGELVLDEYEKVESIRNQSERALRETLSQQKELLSLLVPDSWENIQDFADGLSRIHRQRGRIITLRNLRYMDLDAVDRLEGELESEEKRISSATAVFLTQDRALVPFTERIQEVRSLTEQVTNAAELIEPRAALEKMASDLDMLSNLMVSLPFDDVALQTQVVEGISEIYAQLNQVRSRLEQRRKELGKTEDLARFSAQFKLFGQSIANALGLSNDPERCDDELSRLLLQLEELESQFGDHEEFLADIFQKRDEMLEAFETHKQTLLDERQRRAQGLLVSAERILSTLPRRLSRFTQAEELNAFFVSDPLARKIMEIAERLRELKDTVKADDVEARFKAARNQALRSLRDKTELYEEGGATIKLGPRHRFSVNTHELDLTILPQDDTLYLHLTGTDYREAIHESELDDLRDYWHVFLESESPDVSRAEFLAYSVIYAASKRQDDLSIEMLHDLLVQPEELEKTVRAFAAPRYREGYEKGIHDHDAALILKSLLPLGENADLLRFAPGARALAMIFWQFRGGESLSLLWPEWAKISVSINTLFTHEDGLNAILSEMEQALDAFACEQGIRLSEDHLSQAAEFLCQTLARTTVEFACSKYARLLYEGLRAQLEERHMWSDFMHTQKNLGERLGQRRTLALHWLQALATQPGYAEFTPYAEEAAALVLLEDRCDLTLHYSEVDLQTTVSGLLGDHPRVREHSLIIVLDDYFSRMRHHRKQVIPGYRRYQGLRQGLLERERASLRLSEFKPNPLNSFVRNRLIDQVYLPIIGDNLAKQMGTVGETKRTDLMGLLLLISPPGYGKTTLMEYIASCLGLIFMKINGPSLGHEVRSLDPAQAPDATARQELEKLNLALEMGNNVMLYVDDIQHTNPEFLQKFISLCDGTRRIEGVWKGKTRTYDMRGKKFCVVMAGNPYTESGEVFKIPDMLSNRADVYNLGEVLGGMEDAFALSYLENCLTSNAVLAPLAQRDMKDLYHFIDRAMDKSVSANDLSHDYSDAESEEITAVLKRLLWLRDVVLLINRHYIASASQSEKYRTEPAFKLQGSYRSMNKLAERVSAVMNDRELDRLLDDHYLGEAQLLTDHAEENLLKLAEIRGKLTAEQMVRWQRIKEDFLRNKAFGGDQGEVGDRVVAQLADLVQGVQALGKCLP